MLTIVTLTSGLSTLLLWNSHSEIKEYKTLLHHNKVNTNQLGEELKSFLKGDKLQHSKKLTFLKTPYCSKFRDGYITVLLIKDQSDLKIWDIYDKDFLLHKNVSPNFLAKMSNGIGGLAVEVDDRTYFLENLIYDDSGIITHFILADTVLTPCR